MFINGCLPLNSLPNPYLNECLILEVCINNKRGSVVSVYFSPSQTSNDFNSFTTNLEKLVINISSTNSHFILITGDFNDCCRCLVRLFDDVTWYEASYN